MKRLQTALGQGLSEIRIHWFRSVLTIIGVIMGVAALMSMLALTEGMARGFWENTMQTGGDTKAIIKPAAVPPDQRARKDISAGLTAEDAAALRKNAPLLTWVSPAYVWGSARIERGNRHSEGRLYAAELALLDMDKMKVSSGRFLTQLDLERKTRVCVLGAKPAAKLFDDPEREAVGSTVNIRGLNFRVVGLFPLYLSQREQRARQSGMFRRQAKRREARGNTWGEWDPFWWKNNMVAIPLTTAQATFNSAKVGSDGQSFGPGRTVSEIQVGFADLTVMNAARDQAENVLLHTHRGIVDFQVTTAEAGVKEAQEQMRAARVTGGIIAGISLLVGCLGIVNIMLASITDRLREIGIRQAVGATPTDIFLQVMTEAVLLTLIGGILGVAASFALMQALEQLAPEDNLPIVTASSIVVSLAFAVLTGLIAGAYPALKASRLNPIEAMRGD